jgi:hypothetical protein
MRLFACKKQCHETSWSENLMQLSESSRRRIESVVVGAAFEVLSTINTDLTKELIHEGRLL